MPICEGGLIWLATAWCWNWPCEGEGTAVTVMATCPLGMTMCRWKIHVCSWEGVPGKPTLCCGRLLFRELMELPPGVMGTLGRFELAMREFCAWAEAMELLAGPIPGWVTVLECEAAMGGTDEGFCN